VTTARTVRFDWKQSHDLRNFDHLHDEESTATAISHQWPLPDVLDQGRVGSCTGNGSAAAMSSLLWEHRQHNNAHRMDREEAAMCVYELGTSRDEFAGDWPTADTGSSVNGVLKAGRDLGIVKAWSWCRSEAAIRHAVLTVSPVVWGVPFYASMEEPVDGYMLVDPATELLGGHCMCLLAFDGTDYLQQNSWGDSWGTDGRVKIRSADVRLLLDEGAEAACFTLAYV
jgi:hypothetical protein